MQEPAKQFYNVHPGFNPRDSRALVSVTSTDKIEIITVLPAIDETDETIPGPSTAMPVQIVNEQSKSKHVKIHRHGAGTTPELNTVMPPIV